MGLGSSTEKDAMNTKTEEGEVIFDIRELIYSKGDVFVVKVVRTCVPVLQTMLIPLPCLRCTTEDV